MKVFFAFVLMLWLAVTQGCDARAESVKQQAERGDDGALYSLGLTYFTEGVLRDDVQAYKWLSLAAASGNAYAREDRDEVARRMTPAQIAEAQRLAAEWMKKHR